MVEINFVSQVCLWRLRKFACVYSPVFVNLKVQADLPKKNGRGIRSHVGLGKTCRALAQWQVLGMGTRCLCDTVSSVENVPDKESYTGI